MPIPAEPPPIVSPRPLPHGTGWPHDVHETVGGMEADRPSTGHRSVARRALHAEPGAIVGDEAAAPLARRRQSLAWKSVRRPSGRRERRRWESNPLRAALQAAARPSGLGVGSTIGSSI